MANDREYERALEAAEDTKVRVEIDKKVTGEVDATVVWGTWISDGVPRHGGAEGPMSVGDALHRADEIASLYGFEGVVVQIEDERHWDPQWGTLQARPAAPEDDRDYDPVADPRDTDQPPTKQWI